jgi:uncharacterized membrane protein
MEEVTLRSPALPNPAGLCPSVHPKSTPGGAGMAISLSKERVETFSDGVFAIVLTLLVLELHGPTIANHSNLGQYAAAMAPLIPKLASFALTFLTICVNWVSHNYFFRHLNHVTLGLVWLNNLLLLSQCLYPFPTAMLGDHLTDQFPVLLYGATTLFGGLTWYALRSHAGRARLFEKSEYAKTQGPVRSYPGIAIAGLSILLSFVNVYLSLACLFLLLALYFVTTGVQTYIHRDRVQKVDIK